MFCHSDNSAIWKAKKEVAVTRKDLHKTPDMQGDGSHVTHIKIHFDDCNSVQFN
jgi:hypothetical protein